MIASLLGKVNKTVLYTIAAIAGIIVGFIVTSMAGGVFGIISGFIVFIAIGGTKELHETFEAYQ